MTCLCAALAFVAPAGALESLTGEYDGTLSCKGIDSGNRGKFKETDVPIDVADLGGGEVLVDVAGLVVNFTGFVIADLAKPDSGVLSAIQCGLDDVSRDGAVMNAEVKTKAGTEKASFKATLIILNPGAAEAVICKLGAKRVSTQAKKLAACP